MHLNRCFRAFATSTKLRLGTAPAWAAGRQQCQCRRAGIAIACSGYSNMLDLEALVAASRCAAQGERSLAACCLPEVAAHALQLLRDIKQGSIDPEEQQSARQGELVLCFRVMRNAAAVGPSVAAVLLAAGLPQLACDTLDLIATAVITLNWQLPAALAQALANLCNASSAGAAAAWAALFPLHFSMLAHVNAGKPGVAAARKGHCESCS